MSAQISSSASVFIQIWVDINAIQNGSSNGVYLVDNRVSQGSSLEGSAQLNSQVTNGSTIQWNIYNIDATSTVPLSIQSIGNASVWGAGGQPQSDGHGGFLGQVQATGSTGYQITL